MKRKAGNDEASTISKRRRLDANLKAWLPRELFDLISDYLDSRSSRMFRNAFDFKPRLSDTPWSVIFKSTEWAKKMIADYNATPLLIGSSLDRDSCEAPKLVLYRP